MEVAFVEDCSLETNQGTVIAIHEEWDALYQQHKEEKANRSNIQEVEWARFDEILLTFINRKKMTVSSGTFCNFLNTLVAFSCLIAFYILSFPLVCYYLLRFSSSEFRKATKHLHFINGNLLFPWYIINHILFTMVFFLPNKMLILSPIWMHNFPLWTPGFFPHNMYFPLLSTHKSRGLA